MFFSPNFIINEIRDERRKKLLRYKIMIIIWFIHSNNIMYNIIIVSHRLKPYSLLLSPLTQIRFLAVHIQNLIWLLHKLRGSNSQPAIVDFQKIDPPSIYTKCLRLCLCCFYMWDWKRLNFINFVITYHLQVITSRPPKRERASLSHPRHGPSLVSAAWSYESSSQV